MRIPYVRPSLPDAATIVRDVEQIFASGRLTKGPVVREYEEALAQRLGVRHVVATSSCTVGLALLYKALGIQGAVITPSYTFMATVNALVWAGGTPVFVDVDRDSWTLDPKSVEESLTPEIEAIVAVPVFGVPCDVESLQALADRARIPLVFDSAHGVGSYRNGLPLGGFGRAEVFSTTPTKTLVTGEGGFITTNDNELAENLRIFVEYGNDGSFDTLLPGLNGRLPEISAVIGLRMLDILDDLLKRRRKIVTAYREQLAETEGLRLQHVPPGCVSSYNYFTFMVDENFGLSRDELAEHLAERGIETKKYFWPSVHRHRPYRGLGYEGKLPVTERLEREALSVPLWSGLSDEEVEYVVTAVLSAAR